MSDKFIETMRQAEEMLSNENCSKLLLSWDTVLQTFTLHNLTMSYGTSSYWNCWSLIPLCYIVPQDVKQLKDEALLQSSAQNLFRWTEGLLIAPASLDLPTLLHMCGKGSE